jgi:hypothetical protein
MPRIKILFGLCLNEIALLAGTDTSYQKMLSNGELIRFIANVLYSPYTSSKVGHQALRAWMRLCRRQELVKATYSQPG